MRFVQALALCSIAAAFALPAQAGDKDGYWVDKDGNILKSANTGMCIRSVRWSEGKADADCRERLRKATLASKK
jgi:hypothetical protein